MESHRSHDITAAAERLFSAQGYHATSVRHLAGAVNLQGGSLYAHFDSKEELLFMIQDRSLRKVLTTLRGKLEGVDSAEEKLRILVHNHVGFFSENMAAMRVITHEYDSLEGEYRTRITELRREYSDVCQGILREVRRFTSAGDVAPLNVATSALFGMMNWIYAWYTPGSNVPAERLAEHIYRLFTGGFIGRPGKSSTGRRAG